MNYRDAKSIRFSCAYLFRILINGKYFLVKDEQGREHFQPVGGVYKYTDDEMLDKTNAVQCMRFGNDSDLDSDLRLVIPRNKASKFLSWFKSDKGRENLKNLYREFEEEILDRIESVNDEVFKTIKYRYIGQHIETGRMGERDMQIRIADVVELIPNKDQVNEFAELMKREGGSYCFASKEDIYEVGRTVGNQIQTISEHAKKILVEEEKYLKKNRFSGKCFEASIEAVKENRESWPLIEKADTSKDFTFISYNSADGRKVWDFCNENTPPLNNIWIDRKLVSEDWQEDAQKALQKPTCKKAVVFINKEYLLRSSACYKEASWIVENKVPHIVVLVDIDIDFVKKTILRWIENDGANKEKLVIFKQLLHYDDNTAHMNISMFKMKPDAVGRMMQAYNNL